jgi:multidrug efflux pump subunit AcrB
MKDWAISYRYELGGEIETSGKANKSIFDKPGIAALIILLLLVWQFDSIRKPVIIAVPFPWDLWVLL